MAAELVTLHSSWRGFVTSLVGASAVLVGGAVVVAGVGWRVIPTVTLLAGIGFSLVVLLDYPIASTFDARGVTRRMLLRHQRLSWDRVAQLSRSRPGIAAGLRKLSHGGLVAVVGRRRYLLTDRGESAEEFAALELLLDQADSALLERVPRPGPGGDPTWLYRRARWAPDTKR